MKNVITYKGIVLYFLYFALSLLTHKSFSQCTCTPISANLVADGGFEIPCAAPVNFQSDMFLHCNNGWPINNFNNGIFYIGSANNRLPQWSSTPQVGTGGASTFVADGIHDGGGSNRAWFQNVNVIVGNKYVFSFDYYEEQAGSPAMSLIVNGVTVAQTGNAAPDQWHFLCGSWIATLTGVVEIAVRRSSLQTFSYMDNDFSLDNISFIQIPNFQAVPQSDKYLCNGVGPITIGPIVLVEGSGNYSYLWSTGETTSQISVFPNVTTTYSVIITDNITGCVTSDQIKVVTAILNVSLDPEVMICVTGPTQLSPKVTGGTNNYSYLWNTGATTSSIFVPYNSPGIYTVTVTDNTSGCIATANVRAAQWECQGTKLYQNTSSLPSFSHYNIIKAGYNVDNTNPVGNVTVLNGQNVVFHGSSSIELLEGFTASEGSEFTADIITRCSFGNAYIQKNDIDACQAKLTAIVENGSGNYSYQWNTGATTKEIIVSPSVNTSYSVLITDNCLGNDATPTYNLDVHYRGGFSYDYGNLITPNGDGLNDTWVVTDNAKTQYAFNAHRFLLRIYNRWGAAVWLQAGQVPLNGTGFKQGDIYWNGNESNGVYYFDLHLFNCDQNQLVNGWIQILGSNYRMASKITTDSTNNGFTSPEEAYKLVVISPNPSTGIFNYVVNSSDNTIQKVAAYDMYGAEIIAKENEFGVSEGTLDLSSQTGGVYFLHFQTSQGREVKRVLLNKY